MCTHKIFWLFQRGRRIKLPSKHVQQGNSDEKLRSLHMCRPGRERDWSKKHKMSKTEITNLLAAEKAHSIILPAWTYDKKTRHRQEGRKERKKLFVEKLAPQRSFGCEERKKLLFHYCGLRFAIYSRTLFSPDREWLSDYSIKPIFFALARADFKRERQTNKHVHATCLCV